MINWLRALTCFALLSGMLNSLLHASETTMSSVSNKANSLFHVDLKVQERLKQAIANPEFLLNHWVELPSSPKASNKRKYLLTLREAILLALRYNPNIQNAELDRIVQRYQLRLACNEFEVQYALAGASSTETSHYSDVGSARTNRFIVSPELNLKTKTGGQLILNVNNTMVNYGNYNPVLTFTYNQPLLRGFGRAVNQVNLQNAMDNERLNKLTIKQTVTDQITQVITAYRSLILSANNLQNQKRQLLEARRSYEVNEQKIKAGQLEPTGNIQQSYQIESLNLLVEQGENDFKTAAQDLLQVIGLDPEMHLAIPGDIVLDKLAIPDLKQSIHLALLHNTQYLAQKIVLRADERAYQVAQNQQLWQLDFGANVQGGTLTEVDGNNGLRNIYNGRNHQESAHLNLTIPINDIERRSQLIRAKVDLEKNRLNCIALKRGLITHTTNLVNAIKSQAKQYQLAKKQVFLAEQSYDLEKKKQQAGIANVLDVNNTQNQLIQAQGGLISAKISYLNHLVALQQLLGTTLDDWGIKLRYGQ